MSTIGYMATKLDAFLESHEITTTELATEARLSRKHVGNVRNGKAEPGQKFMARVIQACGRLTKSRITADDLFDFDLPKRKAVGQ